MFVAPRVTSQENSEGQQRGRISGRINQGWIKPLERGSSGE
jgi:hypothetical protein